MPKPLASLPLFPGQAHDCSYLPGRTARHEYLLARTIAPAAYQTLMDAGFRRSGLTVYRPICDGCRECVPIRVPAVRFKPSRSQRRVLKRNLDVNVEIGPPQCTDEKWSIYSEYLNFQHDQGMGDSREDLEEFLYASSTDTLEMVYKLAHQVVAVGIIDVTPLSLSSVYFYFQPAMARRSLGVFGALCEIEECRRRDLAYWYIGYYVRECSRMNYKAQFHPYELLQPDGNWIAEQGA